MENYKDAFIVRLKRLNKIRKSAELLYYAKQHYKNDPVQFINDWMITYDPQSRPSTIPFLLYPKQEELIKFFRARNDNREDGLCEKCRNVGFTWLAIGFAIWLWLFHPEQKISFGSRKQDLVDKIGDPDSIFEKIRLALRYLPVEMLPKGFKLSEHAPYMRIMNPENGSIMTGEGGDNIGRGGRSTIYFIDEAAFLEHPQKVEAALSENSECKIYISTPNGVGNPFYQKRMSGAIPVFTFNYYDDPRKDEKWLARKKKELDPVILAQEVFIDYSASLENICIPGAWVQAAVNFKLEGLEEGVSVVGLDVADGGKDTNASGLRKGSAYKWNDSWHEGTTKQTARRAYHEAKTNGAKYLCYDSIGVGAGVKGELSDLENPEVEICGVSTAQSPGSGYYAEGKKNEDMYLNLRAQVWWETRRRFKNVYEYDGTQPIDQLISIPNDPELIKELSQPRFFYTNNGKIQIESKKEMAARGLKSPNKADALMLAFMPFNVLNREPSIRFL